MTRRESHEIVARLDGELPGEIAATELEAGLIAFHEDTSVDTDDNDRWIYAMAPAPVTGDDEWGSRP